MSDRKLDLSKSKRVVERRRSLPTRRVASKGKLWRTEGRAEKQFTVFRRPALGMSLSGRRIWLDPQYVKERTLRSSLQLHDH